MRGRRRREGERQRGGARDVEVQWISSQRCGRKRKEGHHFRRSTREYICIYFKEEHKRCNLNEMSDESVNGRRRHCGGGIHDDVRSMCDQGDGRGVRVHTGYP